MKDVIEINQAFLRYFSNKGYIAKESSSLVQKDGQLLFTNAGMNQFMKEFSSTDPTIQDKLITVQRCCRITGKHNDIDNIGYSPNHLTSFTMLGHFVFQNASIETLMKDLIFFFKELGIDTNKLYITQHPDLSEHIKMEIAIVADMFGLNIVDLEENMWRAGDNSPWGYSVELFYQDRQKNIDLEIWNCVIVMGIGDQTFPHYRIDTGGGAERLLSILNNSFDVLHLANNIIEEATREENRKIYDHLLTSTYLSKEVEPSNQKQGYVLRMLLRKSLTILIKYNRNVSVFIEHFPSIESTIVKEYLLLKKSIDKSLKYLDAEIAKGNTNIDQLLQHIKETYGAPIEIMLIYLGRYN